MTSWSFPFSIHLRASCLLVATMLLGASRAPAQNTNVQGSLGLDQAQTQSQLIDFAAPCLQGTDFCLRPTLDTQDDPVALGQGCTSTKQPQTISLVAFCFNIFTGQPIPGANITLQVQARDGSGAHLHTDANRPAGKFDPSSGVVGSDNLLHTVFTSPDVSGITDVTISGTLPDGTTCSPATSTIGTELSGLSAIPASGTGYTTTTSTGHDSSNNFANPSVGTNLQQVPVEFNGLVQSLVSTGALPAQNTPTLTYTSVSLTFGGLFDVDANNTGSITHPWHPPHCGHRRGVEADLRIRNVPAQLRPALIMAITDQHFTMPVRSENQTNPTATHWHLRAR
jgi:hypothetical protein